MLIPYNFAEKDVFLNKSAIEKILQLRDDETIKWFKISGFFNVEVGGTLYKVNAKYVKFGRGKILLSIISNARTRLEIDVVFINSSDMLGSFYVTDIEEI